MIGEDSADIFDSWTFGSWTMESEPPSRSLRRPGRRPVPRIVDHTDVELDLAIAVAVDKIPGFWKIMHGVDAYMERRRRREVCAAGKSGLTREMLSRAALDEEIQS